ncbi:hypothetical protein [Nocardia sp. NPDC057353]|uniref:hypothetical protein n=1 Tax=Nocardia sp. NPDC057353 TaxID=3346104 RepID=UPI00362E9183
MTMAGESSATPPMNPHLIQLSEGPRPAREVLISMGKRFVDAAKSINKAAASTFLLGAIVFAWIGRHSPVAIACAIAAVLLMAVVVALYKAEASFLAEQFDFATHRERARSRFGYFDYGTRGYEIAPGYGTPLIGGQGGHGGHAMGGRNARGGNGGAGGFPGGGGGSGGNAVSLQGDAQGGDGGSGGRGEFPGLG